MHDVAARLMDPGDEVEPPERLPEPAPGRLQLPRGGNPIGISANCKECGITEIEKPGEADNDIKTERQCGKSQRIRGRVDIGVVAVNEREQKGDRSRCDAGRNKASIVAAVAGPAIPERGGLPISVISHDLVGLARPKRPFGAKTRMNTRIEKMMTSVQRTARSWPPSVSMSPIRMPPTIAPVMLPMPPSTAAVNARSPAVYPMMKLV